MNRHHKILHDPFLAEASMQSSGKKIKYSKSFLMVKNYTSQIQGENQIKLFVRWRKLNPNANFWTVSNG